MSAGAGVWGGVNLQKAAERRRKEEEAERPGTKVWLLQLIFLQTAASVKMRRKSPRAPSKDRQEVVSSSDIIWM